MIELPSGYGRFGRTIGSGLIGLTLFAGQAGNVTASPQASSNTPTEVHASQDRSDVGPFNLTRPSLPPAVSPIPYPLQLRWQKQMPGEELYAYRQRERATPVIMGDRILIGTSRARGIFVLDRRSGSIERRIQTRGTVEARMVIGPDDQDLYVGDTEGFFYRFRPDGTKVWEYESPGPVESTAAVVNGRVFFHSIDGALIALEAATGKLLWSFRREARFEEGLAVFGASIPAVSGELVISGFEDGYVAAVRVADGTLAWDHSIVSDGRWLDVDGDPIVLDAERVFIAAYGGPSVCLRIDTGEELWRFNSGGAGHPYYHDHVLYLPDPAGAIFALNADSGEKLWRWALPGGGTPNSPVFWRGMLVVTTSTGHLYMLNPRSGHLDWEWRPVSEISGYSSSASAGDGALYVISEAGGVYQLVAPDFQPEPARSLRPKWIWPGE